MNMMVDIGNLGELTRQANIARTLGSPFVASVLEAGRRHLSVAPSTTRLIAQWPGDPSAAALAMRFNAALHAIARSGRVASLSALYCGKHQDFEGAVRTALRAEDGFIADFMRHTPQTNEVGRAASLYAAMMVATRRTGLPLELLELGSSAGLNLNMAHYAYNLGGLNIGSCTSKVRIAPIWHGAAPSATDVTVVSARGVDLNPLDPANAQTRERLLSFIWADQPMRAKRLEEALRFAQSRPPVVERDDARSWLVRALTAPQETGVCRVVFHSMVVQYFSAQDRADGINFIKVMGEQATTDRPLAWISFEWTPSRSEVRLMVTLWPTGDAVHLATCHPYGNWVQWHGEP